MLSLIVLANEVRSCVPCGLLVCASVPHYAVVLGTNLLCSALPVRMSSWVDESLWGFYQRLVLFVFETVSGVQIRFYGTDLPAALQRPERVLYMSNHQCTVDWIVADILAARQNTVGQVRYMLKDTLCYIPLYGWYFYHHGCVYVRRSGKLRADIVNKQLDFLAQLNHPFWLVIFPEGTRFSAHKRKQLIDSQTFSREHDLPVLHHVLTPRATGMLMAIQRLREHVDAVYDVTIMYGTARTQLGVHKDAPDMFSFVCTGLSRPQLHIRLDRIPIEDVPEDQAQFKLWLHDRFLLKDQAMSRFYSGGFGGSVYEDEVQLEPLPAIYTSCAVFVYCTALAPALLVPQVRRTYLTVWLAGSVFGVLWLKLRQGA